MARGGRWGQAPGGRRLFLGFTDRDFAAARALGGRMSGGQDIHPLFPAPSVLSVTPNSGTAAGGTAVLITGSNFRPGATVTFGASGATGVVVNGPTSISCTTPAHAVGPVTVTVTNPDAQTGSLVNGYTYTPAAMIVAVGSGANVSVYSTDGINWNNGTGLPIGMSCMTWAPELGLFVAIGTAGFGARSPDGHTWTSFAIPVRNFTCIAWNGTIFVTCPNSIAPSLSSTDAITWVDNNIKDSGNVNHTAAFTAIDWVPQIGHFSLIACASNATFNSPDGLVWGFTFPLPTGKPGAASGIAHRTTDGFIEVVGNAGTNRGMTSPDAGTWTVLTAPGFPALDYSAVAYGSAGFVAITPSGVGSLPAGAWRDIDFSPALGLYIAVGTSGGKIGISSDGASWSLISKPEQLVALAVSA